MIEKAFAKKFGSFEALEQGSSRSALIDLTKCPVFTFDFQDKKTLELIYGDDFEKHLEILGGENRNSNTIWDEVQNSGMRSSSSETKLDSHGNLISPVKSLRFSLIKTSKPVADFWKKLKTSVNSSYVVLAVSRDENDQKKEGFGYPIIKVHELDSLRLIGRKNDQNNFRI